MLILLSKVLESTWLIINLLMALLQDPKVFLLRKTALLLFPLNSQSSCNQNRQLLCLKSFTKSFGGLMWAHVWPTISNSQSPRLYSQDECSRLGVVQIAKGPLALSADIWGCYLWGWVMWDALNIPPCTQCSPHQHRMMGPQISTLPRLRNPAPDKGCSFLWA